MKKLIPLFIFIIVASCKSPEARYPVSQKSGSYIDESVARNKKLVAKEEEYIKAIIQKDSANDYEASADGFWYYYNTKVADSVTTQHPEFGDLVTFDYSISTVDGDPIYVEGEKPTQTYAMDQENLFSGLRQGLKLMKEGETVTFLFPSYKAFGYYGDKNKIGTNVPLTAKVSLHSIEKQNNNETDNQ